MTELLDPMNCIYYTLSIQNPSLMILALGIADGVHGPKQMT